ncbi:hypothetical protein EMIT0158MI4_30462 [Burkholderia ambifaria]
MGSAERHVAGRRQATVCGTRRIAEERHGILTGSPSPQSAIKSVAQRSKFLYNAACVTPALGSKAVPARRLVALCSNPV